MSIILSIAFVIYLSVSSVKAASLPWAGTTSGNILLLSDIHLDPFADKNLVKALMQAPVEKWETILEPTLKESFAVPGKDTNYPLMVSALTAAQQMGPYDLAIVTGDLLVHESRNLFEPIGGKDETAYEDFVTKVEVFVVREVQKRLPGTAVYFSLGNNDSECGDYMMATHTRFLDAITHELKTLDKRVDAQRTMAAAGYYIVDHPVLAHTQLVVLNDIYWSNRYSADSCYSQPNDKAGDEEMNWLGQELKQARAKGNKLILVMHIPPQLDIFGTVKALAMGRKKKLVRLFWDYPYEKTFVELMRQYPDVVKMIFAGHTHMDDFRVLEAENGDPLMFTHICPAVSPIRYNNPGFQVMEYDKTTGAIQDEATFYLSNLTVATSATDAQWDLEYDFDAAYGVKNYDAVTLAALTQTLDQDDAKRALFAKYYSLSAPPTIPTEDWARLNDLRLLSDKKDLERAAEKILGQGQLSAPVESK